MLADHHIGEEAKDGTFGGLCVGVPSGGEARVEVESVEHKVSVGIDFHYIEVMANGVICVYWPNRD